MGMTSESNDREKIEEALQRVRSGELSPAEATELLLASEPRDAEPDTNQETLASLIDRLGNPPQEVARFWCQQFTIAAAIHEQENGNPFPPVSFDDWSIDSAGRLFWKQSVVVPDGDTATPQLEGSLDSLNQVRQHLNVHQPEPQVLLESSVAADSGDRDGSTAVEVPKRNGTFRRIAFAAAFAGCSIAVGAILYNASRPDVDAVASTSSTASKVERTELGGSDDLPSTDQAFQELPASDLDGSEPLQTFDSMLQSQIESNAESADDHSLSLDALMPAAADFLPAGDSSPNSPSESADQSKPDSTPTRSVGDRDAGSIDDLPVMQQGDQPGDQPDESLQETRLSTIAAVELPPPSDPGAITTLWESPSQGLTLEFPVDVALQMNAGDTDWLIKDSRNDTSVATIRSTDNQTQMQWHESATQSASAAALVHGRLKGDSGRLVYLRPSIEADPWPIRLDRADVRPTWDLRSPIPSRVSRLAVEFDLPDDVEVGWIEPIDPAAIRRGQAVALLTPGDGETVALGLRLDIRCGRKLSCRIRFAARLDPAMPWQVVSTSTLGQFDEQLTEQAEWLSRELARLSSVYERAGSDGRRILRVKQERTESQAERNRQLSKRVAELQTLISTLETGGAIRFQVTVGWPQDQQTILSMKSPL